jgi:hypothetical protein
MSDDWDWVWSDDEIEIFRQVEQKSIRRQYKIKMKSALKRESLSDIFQELPDNGESLHLISNGHFDYFTFVPLILDMLPQKYCVHFYGSTWTMSRQNVLDLFDYFDNAKVGQISIFTGLYFKRRESAVYATLLEGIQSRKQRYIAFKNHAKIMLFNHQDTYLTVEGSANFTANPRLEQTTITNDKALWQFHVDWMEEILNG